MNNDDNQINASYQYTCMCSYFTFRKNALTYAYHRAYNCACRMYTATLFARTHTSVVCTASSKRDRMCRALLLYSILYRQNNSKKSGRLCSFTYYIWLRACVCVLSSSSVIKSICWLCWWELRLCVHSVYILHAYVLWKKKQRWPTHVYVCAYVFFICFVKRTRM